MAEKCCHGENTSAGITNDYSNIDWSFPAPRPGILGVMDRFIGPGATRTELILQLVVPLIAGIAAFAYAQHLNLDWTLSQYLFCGIFAIDMVGGVVTNATSTAKRWYHRKGQTLFHHLGFVSLHLLHLALVSWLYLQFNLKWIAISGSYLLMAALIVLLTPHYLKRTLSLITYCGSLLLTLYILEQPEGLQWFLPFFYLKILVSHLPKEEPYRPVNR